MKKHILLISGNPEKKSLSSAILESYANGIDKSKAEVKKIYLGDLKFDPVLWNGYSNLKLEEDLKKSQEAISWADHVVFIFPVWWGSMPALLKGWLDRILLPGFAFKYYKGSPLPERLLKGKTAHIIRTSGSPTIISFIPEILDGLNWRFNILGFNGIRLIKTTHFSGITSSLSQKRREKILQKSKSLAENF